MYFEHFLMVLRRRWFVLLPLLALSALGALFAYRQAPLSYQAQGQVMFLPVPVPVSAKAPATGSDNPYLTMGRGLFPAMNVVTSVVTDPNTQDELARSFPGTSYAVATAPNTTAPILDIVVTSSTAQNAAQEFSAVVSRIDATMTQLQKSARTLTAVAPKTLIVPELLSQAPPTPMSGNRLRATLAVALLGAALSLAVTFAVDGAGRHRRVSYRTTGIEELIDLDATAQTQ